MSNIQLLLEKLIKNRIHQVRGWRLRTQILVLFFISALPVILRVSLDRETTKPPEGILGPQSIDTLIPHGFTLVPIEVQNSDSLNSILGNKGIVNLLAPPREEGQKTRLIAQRVPILRAPLNPSQFAVLVPEKISRNIAQEQGPFWVVIQNPQTKGMSFEKANSLSKRSIQIIDGGVN